MGFEERWNNWVRRLKKMEGLEALLEMKQRWPDMNIVLMTTFEDTLQAATALEHGAEGYMLKSIHPREMKEALKLIYNGGTWIDQSVATRVFEEMKRQREQLEKIGSSKESYPYGLTKTRNGDSGASVKRPALQVNRRKAIFIEGTVRNCSKLDVNNRDEAIKMARTENIV